MSRSSRVTSFVFPARVPVRLLPFVRSALALVLSVLSHFTHQRLLSLRFFATVLFIALSSTSCAIVLVRLLVFARSANQLHMLFKAASELRPKTWTNLIKS